MTLARWPAGLKAMGLYDAVSSNKRKTFPTSSQGECGHIESLAVCVSAPVSHALLQGLAEPVP